MQRSKYTTVFKAEAFKQVVVKGQTLVGVASGLGLGECVLYNWIQKSKVTDEAPLGEICSMYSEVAILKAELRGIIEERYILIQGLGVKPEVVYADLGYRGVDKDNPQIEIKHRGKDKRLSDEERRLLKLRQVIEPIIGHL
jgi:transposase-like protein